MPRTTPVLPARRQAARGVALLVLAVLGGLLGMHVLTGPSSATQTHVEAVSASQLAVPAGHAAPHTSPSSNPQGGHDAGTHDGVTGCSPALTLLGLGLLVTALALLAGDARVQAQSQPHERALLPPRGRRPPPLPRPLLLLCVLRT